MRFKGFIIKIIVKGILSLEKKKGRREEGEKKGMKKLFFMA